MSEITGGCLCGAIRYTLTGDALATMVCHCTHCQKQTGTSFSILLAAKSEAVTVNGPRPAHSSQFLRHLRVAHPVRTGRGSGHGFSESGHAGRHARPCANNRNLVPKRTTLGAPPGDDREIRKRPLTRRLQRNQPLCDIRVIALSQAQAGLAA